MTERRKACKGWLVTPIPIATSTPWVAKSGEQVRQASLADVIYFIRTVSSPNFFRLGSQSLTFFSSFLHPPLEFPEKILTNLSQTR